MSFLQESLVYLVAAVVAVTLFRRLKLGSVLGYLISGVVIGPAGLGLIDDVESVLHFAEFGVVLLLFLIGLELQPNRLWGLRRSVFGLGAAQMLLTTPLLALGATLALGVPWVTALVVGAGLSLSSTAFALQLLGEKNQLASPYGQSTFGILLFQDLAVIPLLAILPFLGTTGEAAHGPFWLGAARVVGVLALVVGGRYLLRPLFRVVTAQHSAELFTATALLVVVGTSVLVQSVGLSMALGAFLAGVMLADSEYRHALEADLEPFKGLLLGLFFIAVGMSVNVQLVVAKPWLMGAGVTCLVLIKGGVLLGIGLRTLNSKREALRLGLIISQGGEFAFVLFRLCVGFGAMEQSLADMLVAVVSLSMATTPLLFAALEAMTARKPRVKGAYNVAPEQDSSVIIAGFGRVGQVVGRVLRAKRITFTALDSNPEHIEFISKFGGKVFFGDASRLDLLRAARTDRARVFVLAIDDPQASLLCAETMLMHFPQVALIARARNRQHAYRLYKAGVKHVIRETWDGSLSMTEAALEAFGLTYSESVSAVERFKEHDEALVKATYPFMDDLKKLQQLAADARAELESIFDHDARQDTGTDD